MTFKYLCQSANKVNKNRIHGEIWAFYSFVAVKHVHLLLQQPKQSHKFSNQHVLCFYLWDVISSEFFCPQSISLLQDCCYVYCYSDQAYAKF